MGMVDKEEVRQLYQRYGQLVHRRCRGLLGDEEEAYDVMQEVFIRLIQHGDSLRGEASPLTWIYRVTTNLCLNRLRDGRSRARKLAQPDPSAVSLPGMGAFAGLDPERRRLVETLLAKVDDETRAVVVYYFVDELTLEEIATLVNLSVPTLRKRIQHFQGVARRTLGLQPSTMLLFLLLGLQTSLLPSTVQQPSAFEKRFLFSALPEPMARAVWPPLGKPRGLTPFSWPAHSTSSLEGGRPHGQP